MFWEMVSTILEGRIDELELRMANLVQGMTHLESEFTSIRDLILEAINEMRNRRRVEERGKAVVGA